MCATRDALIFHVLFGVAAFAVMALLKPPTLGLGILGLVVTYNMLLPVVAYRLRHDEWLAIWAFLLPLSVFQVVPDWMLSQLLGVLHFPDLGAPRIGTVPVYMAGLWVIPLFFVLWIAGRSTLAAAAVSLLIFGASEWAAPLLKLWTPQHLSSVHLLGIADYVLLPEALLGAAALIAFQATRDRNPALRIGAAAMVSVFYSGALVVSYFLIERAQI